MKQILIKKWDWMLNVNTKLEAQIINKFVEDGWYNKEEYEALITKMKDFAKDVDYETWYTISYYLSFDNYYEELKGTDLIREI